MKTLIIDTSTDKSLIVFSDGEKMLLSLPFPPGPVPSKILFTTILSGFESLKMDIEDIEAVAVTIGPGSYTGTRVGVAAAKGIAFGRSLPLVGVCSLSGFISNEEGPFVSLIDAHMAGAYVMFQQRKGSVITGLTPPKLLSREQLTIELQQDVRVISPSLKRFSFFQGIERYPDPSHLAKLTYHELNKGRQEELKIIYLRHPIQCQSTDSS